MLYFSAINTIVVLLEIIVVCFSIYYRKPTKNLTVIVLYFHYGPLKWSIRQLTCAFHMLCSQIKNSLHFSQSFLSMQLLLKSNILYLQVLNDAEVHQRFETYSRSSRRLEKISWEYVEELVSDHTIFICIKILGLAALNALYVHW